MSSWTDSILLVIVGVHVVALAAVVVYMRQQNQQEVKEKKD